MAAGESRRTFTFATPAAITLGALAGGEQRLACGGYGELALRVAGKLPKRTFARLTISAQNGDRWELKLDDEQLRRPINLRLCAAAYRFAVDAPHFVRAETSVTIADRPAAIALTLQPSPTLAGIVRERKTRDPLAGAIIATDGGDTAITDLAGRYSLEPGAEKWPAALTISAPGHAPATVAVPRAHASKTLDDVLLGRGGTIMVDITRGVPGAPLTVDLGRVQSGAMIAAPVVKTAMVAASEHAASLIFEAVEPGDYAVIVKGEGPAERRAEAVNVLDGEVKHVSMDVVPFRLTIRARYQGEPLADASIRLRNAAGHWEASLKTNADGEAATRLWQGGKSTIMLGAPGMFTAPYSENRELAETDGEWLVDVAAREITGVVIDTASGEPVPAAKIILQTRAGSGMSSRITAGSDGRFRYAPAPYGSHTLTALAKGYLPAEMSYVFSEPEQRRELVVRLERASSTQVAVIDGRGAPVAGAQLAVFRGSELVVYGRTDDAGVGEVPTPVGQSYDVYAIPRDGSFGATQVGPQTTRTTLRIADGVSRIVVKTESESHSPIARVWLLIRYNGRFLPDAVLKAIGDLQGVRMQTGADGVFAVERMPAGLYEFWPAGSLAELRALAASAADAPAKVIAAPGMNAATMTFAPAH